VTSPSPSRRSWSVGFQLFAGAIGTLVAFRQSLPSDLPQSDVRERLAAKAREEGLLLLREIPFVQAAERDRDLLLSDVLHGIIDQFLEGRESVTVGDALNRLDELLPWEAWLLDYVEKSGAEEQEPDVPDLLSGHTFRVDVPTGEGFTLPVLVAVATPFTPKKDWLAKVKYRFEREFGPMVRLRPESLREGARCTPWWMEGLDSQSIADRLLTEEGFRDEIVAETELEKDRLYQKALAKRAVKVRKLKERFLASVTKVVAPKSQG